MCDRPIAVAIPTRLKAADRSRWSGGRGRRFAAGDAMVAGLMYLPAAARSRIRAKPGERPTDRGPGVSAEHLAVQIRDRHANWKSTTT
jgi:hypothetical protein